MHLTTHSGYRPPDPVTTRNLHKFAMRFTAVVFVLAANLAVISRKKTTFLVDGLLTCKLFGT